MRHNATVHRAAANDFDFNKPRGPRLRVQRIVQVSRCRGGVVGWCHCSGFLCAGIIPCWFLHYFHKESPMVNYHLPPAASRHFDGKLYQTMNEDLQLAGMSKRTVHGYLREAAE